MLGSEKPIQDQDNQSLPSLMKSSGLNKQDSTVKSEPLDTSSRISPPNTLSLEDQLESAKTEMGEVREENKRLKSVLARVVKDYQSLQMQFSDIVQQEQLKTKLDELRGAEEHELVSLSLGTGLDTHKMKDKVSISSSKDKGKFEGLTLGLDCKIEESNNDLNEPISSPSPDNSSDEYKDEQPAKSCPPNKTLTNEKTEGDDEVVQQPQLKKTRVSVRARCDTPTMNDGCQWRKYGQKIAKGNPCPRAYYRCTMSHSCPVRKQVQRCMEDMSILITTYEGTHNHPLPMSATAMASTTSAAANMLISGSSASSSISIPSLSSLSTPLLLPTTFTTTNANLHGLNFSLSNTSTQRPQFYLPNTINTSFSSISSHPTITLDLTSQPNHHQSNKFSSPVMTDTSRYPSTSFKFSSSESVTLPMYSSNTGSNSYNVSYGSMQLHNKSTNGYNYFQSSLQSSASASQHTLTDTIAKALTSDPSFQSVVAAALTSYIGGHGGSSSNGSGGSHGSLTSLSSQLIPAITSASLAGNNSHVVSYLSGENSSSLNNSHQQGSLVFMQTSSGLGNSMGADVATHADQKRDDVT